jgi:hypothetical protein
MHIAIVLHVKDRMAVQRGLPPRLDGHNEPLGVPGSHMYLRIMLTQAPWNSDNTHAPERFERQLRESDSTALPAG